ncbi:MAG TPA: insulinase family protein [Sphaerochaeta sp.]|jgi:Zn-dependent M16 (insulinase) family peptidase|nr:insulinase family protein [Spirochaetota bacterium]NLV61187.1 peptidase M16 [Spirochaetales bacterium]HOE84192.1 insulinase family protein [Sphaerochaeta sp.]HOQ93951.1 insulinase family protein [Sphaerochaeta sp.]HPK46627.1 insulinase family protein [Sphaerochaeta sp.]
MDEHQWSVGDQIAGFQITAIENLEEYQGVGYTFSHIETGMEVFQLVNDDRERFFSYIFKTLPSNNSGVAHILEHCVLAGSERYPVRDPFMSLLKGSVNTFMNAMTYPDKTLYPAASPLKADFDNLFNVYTDAVFAPLLREETFWQEGVRLVCTEEGCRYEGVVFNEMLGDGSDHDSIVGRNSVRFLYSDSAYSFDSGGDPEEIIKLDYQQFVSFYSQFYHPSNAKLFLYGDLEVGEKLAFLEEHYLLHRGSLNINATVTESRAWDRERTATFTSPTENGEGKASNSVVWAWATEPVTDSLEVVTLSTLVDILLGNPAAPLYKAILESGIGEDISPESGMSTDYYQMPMIIGFKGIDADRSEEAGAFILDTLKKIVKDGLDRKLVTSSLKRARFRLLEIPGGAPNGLRILGRAMRGWIYDLGPTATIGSAKPLARLEAAVRKNRRYFEDWIETHLLENPHRCLVTVKGDETYHDRQLEVIAKYTQRVTDDLGKKGVREVMAQNERFDRFEEDGDDEASLATIPRLLIEDLPVEVKENTHQERLCATRPLFVRTGFCNTISYVNIAMNTEDLESDELLLLPFYLRLVQMSGVGNRSYVEVATALKDCTGDFALFLEMGSTLSGDAAQNLICRIKVLPSDAKKALALTADILRTSAVDDLGAVQQVLTTLRGEYRDSVTYSAHGFASLAAAAQLQPLQYEGELLSGLSQWLYLEGIERDDLDGLAARMKALQQKLDNRERLTLHLLCDEENQDSMAALLETFVSSFGHGEPIEAKKRVYEQFNGDEIHALSIYRLPSSVSYQAYALRTSERGSDLQAAQALLAQMMSGNELWERIRGQGGAYGVNTTVDVMEELFLFSTYRDPRIVASFDDFKEVLASYAAGKVDTKALESALIAMVGSELRPLSPSQQSLLSFRRLLYHISDEYREKRREQLLAIDSEAIRSAASALIEGAATVESRVVITGSQLLEKERAKDPALEREAIRLPL